MAPAQQIAAKPSAGAAVPVTEDNTGKPWLSNHGKLKIERGNLMKSSWKKFLFLMYDNVIIYRDTKEVSRSIFVMLVLYGCPQRTR